MARLPTLCQLNYDRDLPSSPPPRYRVRSSTTQPSQLPSNGAFGFSQLVAYEKRTNYNDTETTPYRYSSASFPSPTRDRQPPGQELQNALSRDALEQLYSRQRLTTAKTSYSLPVLRSRGGVETSHTVNAEQLNEPTWNQFLNAWVAGKPSCHHAYFKIAGPMNLNNRGFFHFVREFERLPRLPCERFEDHMHHRRFARRVPEKPKKVIEKPEFWQWKGKTEPVIPKPKPKPPLTDSNSPTSCLRAYSARGRISITIPVGAPPSPDISCAGTCRSAPGFSPYSFFSELSLSPFSSTGKPVSPTESRVSGNSLTTATSGIVSCESLPSIVVPEPASPSVLYLPAAPRLPSVVPWEGEDGWGSDISSFHGELAIIPWTVDEKVQSCNIMVEHPLLLEQVTVLTYTSLNAWSVHINVPVEQTLVHPHPLVSSDMVKVDDVDRVTIKQAPLLRKLPDLPPEPPPELQQRAATAKVRPPPKEAPKPKTPPPKELIQQPRKKKEIIKKERVVKCKLVKKADVAKPNTPLPLHLPIPTPDELPTVAEHDDEEPLQPAPVQIPVSAPLILPPLPKLILEVKPKSPSPNIIPIVQPVTPIRTPTPPPKTPTPSPSPEPKQRELGMPDLDPSIGMELERQRRADERRRKALLMYENLKKRKRGPPGIPQMSVPLMDSGWLAQFCIIKREKEELYRRAFESADEDKDGFLSCQDMLLALKGVASVNSLSDAEEEYVYRVLELAGYSVLSGADFKLFAVVAALTQKIASIDNWMKNLIQRMDFKMLDMKVFRAKELFLWNVDETTNQLSLERLMIELKAGGVSQEHQDEVQMKLSHLGALDVLDFLTYLPLFLLMHSSVISNPFDTTRDK